MAPPAGGERTLFAGATLDRQDDVERFLAAGVARSPGQREWLDPASAVLRERP